MRGAKWKRPSSVGTAQALCLPPPPQLEGADLSAFASAGLASTEPGSTVLPDRSPKQRETHSSLAEEEPVAPEQELLETCSCEGVRTEEKEAEQLVERAQEVGDSGGLEAVRGPAPVFPLNALSN